MATLTPRSIPKAPTVAAASASPLRLLPDNSYAWLTAGLIWVLIVYLTVPEGFDYSVKEDVYIGGLLSKLVWIALLAVSLALIVWRGALAMLLARLVNPFFFAVLVLAAASVLWSIEPSFTIKRVVRLLTFLLVAMAFTLVNWHERRFQNVLRPIVTLLMLGSLVFGIVSPELAIEQSDQMELVGAWHGLTMQKNSLGALAGIGLVLWIHAWLAREVSVKWALAGSIVCGACLILSRSSTSLMATVFALVFMLMLMRTSRALRPYMRYLVTLFAVLLLVYSMAVLRLVPALDFVLSPITAITGKDLTFSGRTAIWDIINEHIKERPLLGSGYGAYWIGKVIGTPSYEFVTKLYFYPSQSHNGYLDVINDLGAVGGLCLVGFLIVYVRQALALMRGNLVAAALYLSLLFQQLVANLSEARWFSSLSVDFAIMTVASLAMSRLLLTDQLQFYATAKKVVDTAGSSPVPGARPGWGTLRRP